MPASEIYGPWKMTVRWGDVPSLPLLFLKDAAISAWGKMWEQSRRMERARGLTHIIECQGSKV